MEGELPFFDLGNRDYLILLPKSDHPNRVLWLSGKPLTESVVEFFNRLYDHAGFYLDAS